MVPNPAIANAVEQLDYRVTVGDVATQAGLELNLAQQGLLALASDAGGHLQVAETGDVVYVFPENFRAVLQNKYLRLRIQQWWEQVWKVLFYLIRISFGIVLLVSIALMVAAIVVIIIAANSSRDNNNRSDSRSSEGGGGIYFVPRFFWFGPDWFYVFAPDYYEQRYRRQRQAVDREENELNFLEAVFSFLFGDGNPNRDLEERRWQAIAAAIRNQRGAVVAEQIAPYLDELGTGSAQEYEDYMLPVLARFDGRPQVSPDGQIVYHFPELQTTAAQRGSMSVPAYLREFLYKFSDATSGQRTLAAGLGVLNIVLAIILATMLGDPALMKQLSGNAREFIGFISAIYPVLLGYGVAFLSIPAVRYFWIQGRNKRIEARNEARQERAIALNEGGEELQQKLDYARQFAAQQVITGRDLAYTTESDLTQQELEQSDKIDEEWRRRLEGRQ